jgi:hypothetical protein
MFLLLLQDERIPTALPPVLRSLWPYMPFVNGIGIFLLALIALRLVKLMSSFLAALTRDQSIHEQTWLRVDALLGEKLNREGRASDPHITKRT